MKRWPPRILPRDPLGWLFAILLVGMAVGEVQKIDDYDHEWRCARGDR